MSLYCRWRSASCSASTCETTTAMTLALRMKLAWPGYAHFADLLFYETMITRTELIGGPCAPTRRFYCCAFPGWH